MIKTLRCQTPQQYTTLLHQDARLVEDAANGALVRSLPQVNASVLHATCVGYDSVMVKHVSNSGATVKPTITTYMHTVSTVFSVMIMNCFQSKLQIRMQLMRSPANGIPSPEQRQAQKNFCPLLRIRIKPLQPHHLMMSRTCLDARRHRMDEEFVNFQWFEHVTWNSIKDLRGTTYLQLPIRFKFALQQAQHAILRAIIHNNPSSLASEPAWKALVLSSWLLLGRPAASASETNCAHFLDARLELFWAGDWSALGAWYVLKVTLRQCRMPHAEKPHSRSSHEYAKSPR